MKFEYDKEADAAYIYFKEIRDGEVTETITLNDSVNIDLDKNGKIIARNLRGDELEKVLGEVLR